eukprot:gene15756-17345_t
MSFSDDEDHVLVPKKQKIYFGSLEEKAQELATSALKSKDGPNTDNGENDFSTNHMADAIAEAIKAGNINIAEADTMELNLDETSDRHQELLAEFEKRKRARAIAVPTDNAMVKARLRELGHPICLFGEGPAERRDRLRELLVGIEDVILSASQKAEMMDEGSRKEESQQELWYHEGPDELRIARQFIAEYSLPRAQERLKNARINASKSESEKAAKQQELRKQTSAMVNFCSQIGDERPLSFCQFSPDGNMLATASWSGLCKLWTVPDGKLQRILRGHNDRVGAIIFHPRATLDLDTSAPCMVSCDSDGKVLLWNLESDTPIANIEGHDVRVARVAYHPSGRFLGTACFDRSWRLWDLEQQREVLHQEGHSRECFDIKFQNDGALAASCGFDSRGFIWDLRTGRCIMELDGHLKKVTSIDFSPNGFQTVTGSEDQKAMVWDLRQRKSIYTIPAHTNLISCVKFTDGFIATSSFDNTAKVWAHPGWTPLKSLSGHEQKVTCVDASPDCKYLATTSFDRTFKLWAADYMALLKMCFVNGHFKGNELNLRYRDTSIVPVVVLKIYLAKGAELARAYSGHFELKVIAFYSCVFAMEEKEEESLLGPKFSPPLYMQRYDAIVALVKECNAKTFLDAGCSEGRLLTNVKFHCQSVEEIVGIDIDRDILLLNKFRIMPLNAEYLVKRTRRLRMSLYQGSVSEPDLSMKNIDFVACVEVIEHLEEETLASFPAAMFGVLKPKTIAITTPNAEFNVLFPNFSGFRHPDHKFEWTRKEFQTWCLDCSRVYGYSVEFSGIGNGPTGAEGLGGCSQMAVFRQLPDIIINTSLIENVKIGSYELVADVTYPYQPELSKEKQLAVELQYLVNVYFSTTRQCNFDDDYDYDDDEDPSIRKIPLEVFMKYHRIKILAADIAMLRMVARETFQLTEDGAKIILKCQDYDSSLSDDEMHRWEEDGEISDDFASDDNKENISSRPTGEVSVMENNTFVSNA